MSEENIIKMIRYFALLAKNNGHALTRVYMVKLLYLADLFHARSNEGKTLTGWNWKFHTFGPWSYNSLQSIEKSIAKGYLSKKYVPSEYRDDFALLTTIDHDCEEEIIESVKSLLGFQIKNELQKVIKKHGASSHSLLHYVYEETEPMEFAAPDDTLDFSTAKWVLKGIKPESSKPTKKELKKLDAIKKRLRTISITNHLTDYSDPIYDDEYFQALEAMSDEVEPGKDHIGSADVSSILQSRKLSS